MININEVSEAALIKDYLRLKCQPPTIDSLLDWRNRLIELKQDKEHAFNLHLLDLEVKAVDYLLQEHYS